MAVLKEDEIVIEIKSKADDAAKSVKTLSSELKGLSAALKGLSIAGFLNGFKKMGSSIFSFTEKMSDYIQTMNQFRVVMGSSAEEAQNFINKAQDILGLDPQKMQSALATFKSLGETFGISSNNAYIMSKNLTQLAADMSTFKGISFDQALQKIKSGFVGEIEPMRAVGIALDKATLQETAYRLGIEQRIDTMTRAQKTELLYYQMMTATTQMQGNMAKNLMTPATAIRQIQMEFAQLGRAIGSIFIPMLMKTLPYIRAITELATEAAQALAAMFGFKLGDFAVEATDVAVSLGDVGAGIEDIGSGAGKAAKELRKMLMPFDELNNVNFESATGGSGGAGSIGGIGGSLGIPLEQYDMFANASDEMRKNIDKIKESLKGLVPVIKNVALVMGALWIGKKILDFIIYLGKVKDAFSTLKGVISKLDKKGLIGKISTGLKNLFWNTNLGQSIKNFKNGTGGISKVLLNVASAIGGTVLSIKGFKDISENLNNYIKTGTLDIAKYTGSLLELSSGFALVGYSIGGLEGAIIGGLTGAIVGGIQSLGIMLSKTNEMRQGAIALNEEINAQKKAIDEDKASWDKLSESTNEAISAQLSQTNYMQDLLGELDSYVDVSGQVNDADKERVQFILNELNGAYNTNYKLVDGQITKNGEEKTSLNELKDAIQEVIDKKKAEALLDAMKDKYAEAVQKQKTYYNEYQTALEQQGKTVQKIKDLYKKYGIVLNEVNDETIKEANSMLYNVNIMDMANDGLFDLIDSYNKSGQAVSDAKYIWEDSVDTITNFENLKTAVITGNNEKIEKSMKKITDVVEVNGRKQAQSTEQSLKMQLEEYKKVYNDIDDSQKKHYENQLKATAEELAKETDTVQKLTPQLVNTWKTLAEQSEQTYNDAIGKVSEGTKLAIETSNGTIDITKPETLEKWRNLANSSETEYKKALGMLPDTTSNIIQQAVGAIQTKQSVLNSAASSAGSSSGWVLTKSFKDNTDLSIDSSMVQLKDPWGVQRLGTTISNLIKKGMGTIYIGATSVERIPGFASGGFPQTGQLFMANEAGPELVGNIGRRTAVANQGQITEGIATATYNAISRALAENRGNNGTNPQINVYLGNERLYSGYGNFQDEQSNMYGVSV